MANLYESILALCERDGIRPGRLCDELGISRGLMTDLKMGRKKSVSAETAQKIASFFGVSVGVLLGQEDEAVVKNYMKEHKYNIPGVMPAELGTVPGLSFEGLGFPSMCIVDAEGNFVALSGGKNMQDWKKQIKDFQAEQRKAKKKGKTSEPAED